MSRDLPPVNAAPSEDAAKERSVEFSGRGRQSQAIARLWENAGSEFVAFLDYDVGIRESSAAPTPSSPSTPATGAQSGPGAISPLKGPP